jgi:hypothetical protein
MELVWPRQFVELCHVAFPFLRIVRHVLPTLALSENGVIIQAVAPFTNSVKPICLPATNLCSQLLGCLRELFSSRFKHQFEVGICALRKYLEVLFFLFRRLPQQRKQTQAQSAKVS